MDYLSVVPDDIVTIIVPFLDDQSLKNVIKAYIEIDTVNNINKLDKNEVLFENLVREEFPGFYNEIKAVKGISKWYNIYLELIESIPEGQIEAYHEDREPEYMTYRWKLDKKYILNTEGIINFPKIIYQALFNDDFPDVYKKLVRLSEVPWRELYMDYKSRIEYDRELIDEITKSPNFAEI